MIDTDTRLRPGDVLEFVVTATDPLGEDLEYQCTFSAGSMGHGTEWYARHSFTIPVTEAHVGRLVFANIVVRRKRKYHAHRTYDDTIFFKYEVLPPPDF